MTVESEVVTRSVAKLRPDPRYIRLFGEPSEVEIASAAEELQRNGQTQPLEILLLGDVLSGYRDLLAARQLGLPEVNCIIRHDLESSPPLTALHIIRTHLEVETLDRIAKARWYARIVACLSDSYGRNPSATQKKEARRESAKLLGGGMAGLERYSDLVAWCPEHILTKLESGELSFEAAELAARQMAYIDGALGIWRPPTNRKPPSRRSRPGTALKRLITALLDALDTLEGRVNGVRLEAGDVFVLKSSARLIKELLGPDEEESDMEYSDVGLWAPTNEDLGVSQ